MCSLGGRLPFRGGIAAAAASELVFGGISELIRKHNGVLSWRVCRLLTDVELRQKCCPYAHAARAFLRKASELVD